MSSSRLDAFARGQIVAYAEARVPVVTIAKKVLKKDGTRPKPRAVRKTIRKAKLNPSWRGENSPGGPGRPSTLSKAQLRQLRRLVFKERGSTCVTIKYCKQRIPSLRQHSRFVIAYALHTVGLQWLRRRRKRWVAPRHVGPRLAYARWVLRQTRAVLKSFAFIDGTTYYLARGPAEAADKHRGRLGTFVWRM